MFRARRFGSGLLTSAFTLQVPELDVPGKAGKQYLTQGPTLERSDPMGQIQPRAGSNLYLSLVGS